MPQITLKIKEELQGYIDSHVKDHLSSALRRSFESTLLPAFQSGIDKMFTQVHFN